MPTPTVSTCNPNSGTSWGGTSVEITGSDFETDCTATIGGNAVASLTFNSSNSITVSTPVATTAGVVDIVVTNPGIGTGTLSSGYTYTDGTPTVSSINPNNGKLGGGTNVTISGSSFSPFSTVNINSLPASGVSVSNSTTITCTTPTSGSPGAVNVDVVNPGPWTGTLTNGYTYNPVPTVSEVSPSSGPTTGGTNITITGTGFLSGATVDISGSAVTNVVVVNSTTITGTTPSHSAGVMSVYVTNTDTQTSLENVNFTYEALASSSSTTAALMGV